MSNDTTQHHAYHAPYTPERSEAINEEIEQLEADDLQDQIREESPDGRPAYPTLRSKEMLLLTGGSIFAVFAVSAATYALWGFDEAMLVFGLGVALAVAGNPVVWAMFFRNKEREEIQERNHPEAHMQRNHKPYTR